MTTQAVLNLLIASLMTALAACGGGGGGDAGGNDGGGSNPPPVTFGSALEFQSPSTFANGEAHVTQGSLVSFSGGLNSAATPRGYCPDSTPPQDYTVRWRNAANGRSGSTPIAIGCVTVAGIPGIRSRFNTETILLELGNNRFTFDTFQGNTQVGRDEVLVVRQDSAPPSVSATYPADGQLAVPTNHTLVVVFSEPMNPSTLTADRFVVLDPLDAPVSGQLEYVAESHAWLFRPGTVLAAESTYTITISGAVEDAGGGNALGDDVGWAFVTGPDPDTTAPTVDVQWPGSNCNCASVATRILAGLNEFADPATVTTDSISVTAAGMPIAGTTVYRGDFLEFLPDGELVPGETYTVTVSAALQDPAGVPLAASSSWEFTTDSRAPAGTWYETSQDQPPEAMFGATAVWTGTEVLIWGYGESGNAGGGSYDAAGNSWNVDSAISVGGPSPRLGHSAVWTGTEMIIWGGRSSALSDADIYGGGSAFNVAMNTWTEIAPPGAMGSYATYGHVAVWTGTEMIIWGGSAPQAVNSGWRYDPNTGIATAFTGANAPSARTAAQAVWTGTEMIVWGGFDSDGSPLNDGARYNPVADTWTPLPPVAPTLAANGLASAVWTGTEMILWNGGQTEADQVRNDRMRLPTLHAYDPVQDTWRVSTSGWEPYLAGNDPLITSFSTTGYRAFWTGDRLFVAALYSADQSYLYDPLADSWQAVTGVANLGRKNAAAVWAGSRFVIWGGSRNTLPPDNTGLVFQP